MTTNIYNFSPLFLSGKLQINSWACLIVTNADIFYNDSNIEINMPSSVFLNNQVPFSLAIKSKLD